MPWASYLARLYPPDLPLALSLAFPIIRLKQSYLMLTSSVRETVQLALRMIYDDHHRVYDVHPKAFLMAIMLFFLSKVIIISTASSSY